LAAICGHGEIGIDRLLKTISDDAERPSAMAESKDEKFAVVKTGNRDWTVTTFGSADWSRASWRFVVWGRRELAEGAASELNKRKAAASRTA
jgi:hypothetical protein